MTDSLHKSRLLSVEEKPFKRVTKRLLATRSPVSTPLDPVLSRSALNSLAVAEVPAVGQGEHQKHIQERYQFREDVLLDFAAFESSVARIQFLLTSNERERERYAAEKVKILETAQAVRDSTAQLRLQLAESQRVLAVRKSWDELTEKITSNRMLRPREDQTANLERLNSEIAELERESTEYAQTWSERREQFGRIIKEGMELRRLIRDEKEEVERREGMEDREEGEEGEVETHKGETSTVGTPKAEADGLTPKHRDRSRDVQVEPTSEHLEVSAGRTPLGRSPSMEPSHSPLPASRVVEDEPEDGEDTAMTELGEIEEEDDEGLLNGTAREYQRGESVTMHASPGKSPAPEARLMEVRMGGETGETSEVVSSGEQMDMA